MARGFLINGEGMVTVKGRSDSPVIATLAQLGLAADAVHVDYEFGQERIDVDAWGEADVQVFLAAVNVRMNMIHVDQAVLDECVRLSMGAPTTVGTTSRMGTLLGGNAARFDPPNNYIGLNIASPVAGKPYRFWYARLNTSPASYPLGTRKSVIGLNWRCIPYTNDPWGGGTAQPGTVVGMGAQGAVIWDRTPDS